MASLSYISIQLKNILTSKDLVKITTSIKYGNPLLEDTSNESVTIAAMGLADNNYVQGYLEQISSYNWTEEQKNATMLWYLFADGLPGVNGIDGYYARGFIHSIVAQLPT